MWSGPSLPSCRQRQHRDAGAEAGELLALLDLVGVLDPIEAGRVDLVGPRLQLRPSRST